MFDEGQASFVEIPNGKVGTGRGSNGEFIIEIAIPKDIGQGYGLTGDATSGLTLREGRKIGFNVILANLEYIGSPFDRFSGQKAFLFEPYRFYDVVLKSDIASPQLPPWDVNQDGVVDIFDLVLVGIHFGEDYRTIKAIASLSETGVFSDEKTNVRIDVQNKVGLQGMRLLRVDINTEPVEDLYGCQFDLAFDPKVLKVVGTQSGDLLAQDGASTYWHVSKIDNQTGRIVGATYVRKATKKGINASGTLATVIFEVKDFNISGATRLRLSNVNLADADARLIKAVTKSTLLNWEELLMPEKSRSLQNYPNPFNPETWLPYQLAKEAGVTIRIFNIQGQLIRTLNIGPRETGLYLSKERAAYWNGRNEFGESVASGMYYYSIRAGDFTAARKMLLVK